MRTARLLTTPSAMYASPATHAPLPHMPPAMHTPCHASSGSKGGGQGAMTHPRSCKN